MSVDRSGSKTPLAAGEPPSSRSNPGGVSLKPNRILDAIAKIAANLITAPSLDTALPAALQEIEEAIAADQVVVLEGTHSLGSGFLVNERSTWNAPGVEPRMRSGEMAGQPEVAALL